MCPQWGMHMNEENLAAIEIANEAAKWMNEDPTRSWKEAFLKFRLNKKAIEALSEVTVVTRQ